MSSLLDRLGGAGAVKTVVDEFYTRLLADEKLSHWFENTQLARIKMHQLEFLKMAFTDLPDDAAVMIFEKHSHLLSRGLNETHFDLVAEHLVASLQARSISNELIEEAVGVIKPLRAAFEDSPPELEEEKKEEDSAKHHDEQQVNNKETLMERLGGNEAVKAAVEGLYTRLLDDPETALFFEETNMAHLKQHQIDFMKIAFSQVPRDLDVVAYLKKSHARLFRDNGLNERHFDKVARYFVDVLQDLKVQQELIDEAVAVILPLRAAFEGAHEAYLF